MKNSRFLPIALVMVIGFLAVYYLPSKLESFVLSEEKMAQLWGEDTQEHARCITKDGCEHQSGCFNNTSNNTSTYYNNLRNWKGCEFWNTANCTPRVPYEDVCKIISYDHLGCGSGGSVETRTRPTDCVTQYY